MTMKRLLYALLVLLLFAPVYLCVGYAGLRPSWLTTRVATIPASVLVVVALMAIFVGLAWSFSGQAFAEDEDAQ